MDLEVETFLFEVSETLGDDFTELVTPPASHPSCMSRTLSPSTVDRVEKQAPSVPSEASEPSENAPAARKLRRSRVGFEELKGGERIASPKCRQAQTMIFRPCRERRRRSWDLPAGHASRRWMSR